MGVFMLDEMELRPARMMELVLLLELVILMRRRDFIRAPLERLEDQQIARDMLVDQIERQQRVAKVVKHTHEQHDIEAFIQGCHIIDRELPERDLTARHLAGEGRSEERRAGKELKTGT